MKENTLKNFLAYCVDQGKEDEKKDTLGQIVDSLMTQAIASVVVDGETKMMPFFISWGEFIYLREIEKEFVLEEDHGRFSYLEEPDLIYAADSNGADWLIEQYAKKEGIGTIDKIRNIVNARYPQFNLTENAQSQLIDTIASIIYYPPEVEEVDNMYIYTAIAEFVMGEVFKVYDRFLKS